MKAFKETIVCHFCFETFELDLEVHEEFDGWNNEVYDCFICCSPNKIDYEITGCELTGLIIGNGNE